MMITEATSAALDRLAEAFGVLTRELDAIENDEAGQPVPDDLQVILDEHAAMKATLARLREMGSAEERTRLFNLYRDERKRARGHYEMPNYPVLPEVSTLAEEVTEELRRLALADPELEAILDRHDLMRRHS